jgi:hypothetical protein
MSRNSRPFVFAIWSQILFPVAFAWGATQEKDFPAAAEVATDEWESPEQALPLAGEESGLTSGAKQVLSGVHETLDGGSNGAWRKEKSANGYLWTKERDGLTWEEHFETDRHNVVHVLNRVSLAVTAHQPAAIRAYTFAATDGNIGWSGFAAPNMNPQNFPPEKHEFAIGSVTPYAIFSSRAAGRRLHFYLPDWIDWSGQIEFFEPEDTGRPTLFRLKLASAVSDQPLFTLRPGESRQWEVRIALFDSSAGYAHLGEKDIQQRAAENLRGPFYRREMMTMGFPLPLAPTTKPGHFFIMIPDDKTLDMIPLLARAGTAFLIFQSPDFLDISQGVSCNGDYGQAPPILSRLVKAAHAHGLKVLWWFSIEGVMRAGFDRNDGRGSPLLTAHPDWFLHDYYWNHGEYQRTDLASPGWEKWVLDKIVHDQALYGLDGFAFDEPYFNGRWDAPDGRTFARHGYDFLEALSQKVHRPGPPQWMIGNYWLPQEDEWKFFDYMMTESAGVMSAEALTLGRHTAGQTFASKYFTYDLLLNQLGYNLADYDQAIGWSSPEWYFDLRDATKSPEQIAQLLSYDGKWHRVWAGEIATDLRQIELVGDKGQAVLFCNLGNNLSGKRLFTLHSLHLPETLPGGIVAATDTPDDHREFTVQPATGAPDSFELDNLPGKSITVLHLVDK